MNDNDKWLIMAFLLMIFGLMLSGWMCRHYVTLW
ncbi:MAG: hypothetical protein BWY09_01293 [Candidatus Hydrogenedentes bacterium ADurb.Bin179]|nr:MAG: hypothetical protein BWY09_01293 [Candidatus Hydrogenedentes bacterium ADurb.Bin179]